MSRLFMCCAWLVVGILAGCACKCARCRPPKTPATFASRGEEFEDAFAIERKKNLDSLLKAGVITEEEFSAEVKRLTQKDGRWCEYVVKAGDTMRSIADAHRVDIRKLKAMNGLASDILYVGQILRVPANANGCAGR